MRVIEGMDVNELYWRGMQMLRAEGREEESRVGRVLVFPEPVTSVYKDSRRRVLLDQRRGANPFFHLYESLWMLAGRHDVASLNRFITDFGTRFAESNGHIHGAYGHRWRNAFGFDQLDAIVARLKANPRDRQAVLQMWDGRKAACPAGECDAPDMGSNDLLGNWKDRPCNTHVYFRLRDVSRAPQAVLLDQGDMSDIVYRELDMLVSCRSNDIVFGAYGANAVHFSVLHEYIAGRVGANVGKMEQLSFNYHAYLNVLEKVEPVNILETYDGHNLMWRSMGDNWDKWDIDLKTFLHWHRALVENGEHVLYDYHNRWFEKTAVPMFHAHFKWKNAMPEDARRTAHAIEALDWRYACLQWFKQRTDARSR